MSQIRIVTDSTSDIPPETAARLGITVVPAYVQVGNASYRDEPSSAGLSREAFYAQLPALPAVPTTSVPPVHEFATAYRRLAAETDEVIAVVVSSSLSSMINVARLGAQDVPQLNVHVVDSQQTTMGLGWMAIAAAEAARAGQSIKEILALLQDLKPRVRVYAMLDTLEYLRRSGRVSWARARVAQVLRIRPIIELFLGRVQDIGRTHARSQAIERLIELTHALSPLERLAILHTYAPELDVLRRRLAHLSPINLITTVVTTVIGAHVGPRGLGVALVTAR
jgi:DegV family protein with EDD domain